VRELEKAGIPAITGPNTLVLQFPATYNEARELCQEPDRLGRVEEALRKTTGRPWTLRVESIAAPAAPAATAPGAEAAAPTHPPRRNPREDAEKVPLVRRALEVLGASVHRVDEGFGAAPAAPPQPDAAPLAEEET
jgi:hypothetical protein